MSMSPNSVRKSISGLSVAGGSGPGGSGRTGPSRPSFLHWRWGPTPRRELTPMPRLGFACPRLGMAAGAGAYSFGTPIPEPPAPDSLPNAEQTADRDQLTDVITGVIGN